MTTIDSGGQVTRTDTIPKPTTPCASCGTTEGSKRRGRPGYERYRGERFGYVGMLCTTCRAREVRHQRAKEAGWVPGQVGRRPMRPAVDRPRRTRSPGDHQTPRREPRTDSVANLAPAEVKERLREVREQAEQDGRKPREGETEVETRQRVWAERAAEERRLAVEARRPTRVARA